MDAEGLLMQGALRLVTTPAVRGGTGIWWAFDCDVQEGNVNELNRELVA
jgi:hypothetical protein